MRKRTQRSSSLGPLLDEHKVNVAGLARSNKANTNSLESIDSNPRQAAPKGMEQVGKKDHLKFFKVSQLPLQGGLGPCG